jgi:DNA-binding transcriptional LysR family regulator
MELKQLLYFKHVFEAGSFSKASEELDITQQGLSLSIKKLENELGVIFFVRSKNGIEPTEIATVVKGNIDQLLNSFESLKVRILEMGREVNGVVKIALTPGSVPYIVPKLRSEFYDAYPHIELDIMELTDAECVKAILSGTADLACAMGPIEAKNVEWHPYFKDDVKVIINKDNPLATHDTLTFQDLKNEHFIMPPKGYRWNRLIREFCKEAGYQPTVSYTTGDLSLTFNMIRQGDGIAFMHNDVSAMFTFQQTENIQIPVAPEVGFSFSIGLIRVHNKKPGYAAELLFDFLHNTGSAISARSHAGA